MNLMFNDLKEFDTDAGLSYADEDDALYCEVLTVFYEQLTKRFATLPNQLSNGPDDGVARQIHTLKGSANAVGATRLAAISTQIDSLLKAGELPDNATIENLSAAIQAAIQELAAFVD